MPRLIKPPPLDPPSPAPTDPIAVRHAEILQHLAAANAAQVERRAEVGRLLGEQKAAMPHGAWLVYVEDKLSLSTASVKRARQLHAYANSQPERFAQLQPLGLTKAYELMKLPPADFDAFFAKDRHAVRPHTFKTALEMTFAEMMAVLHGPPKKVPATVKLVKATRRFAKGLLSSIEALLDLPRFSRNHDEIQDSLDIIADETQRVVALLPSAMAAG